ncbi:restriction endonuclease subunit S [Bacillus thuringiensis]|nr:methyltransferase type 11 [Bacillus thuringiensis]PFE66890.1 methyltransferase type 11 [Bacillus thuringiensis]PFI29538.1 methyltransferase type 11 [Bacillus thuringiensis]PFL36426.1 methyltransferase type 11 [Bacillus thuringiensis]PFW20046.1 methyltransferase type 11 [Bacillus thuringiensis]
MEFSNGINAPKENYGKGRKMISVMDILADEPIVYENIRNSVQVDDKTESKNKVENGDLVFVRSSEIPDEVGWAKAYREEEYALYSGFSIRGKKKSDFDAEFIELSLNNSNREQIERKAGGSTRFNVSQSILKSIEILEPSIEEQIKIGDFFKKLDNTIALHQQELTTLKQTKQGFLQKMFPKEGESVPEIRFPGFSGHWEQRKLSDIKDVRDGTHDSPKYYNEGFPLVTSKNLTENGLDMTDVSLISEEDFQSINKRSKVDIGDIIFGMIGTIGNPIIIDREGFAIKNVALIKNGGEVTNEFLIQLLKSPIFEKFIRNENAGNTQKFLGLSKIRNFQFLSPSYQEQTKIGEFFKQLDNTIALHQRELDTLKETKKAFLQKMFI